MFQGKSIRVQALDDGLVELCFDREAESINKLDTRTVRELLQAVEQIAKDKTVQGVLITSAKEVFIVGADITASGSPGRKRNWRRMC
jgi:3-hydroxyacyl-CoA dehydrogenase / enoyl-CoA hydratase / 3-hydroxybutyryl-CoA epimerase / enoyl-CoA isomerase